MRKILYMGLLAFMGLMSTILWPPPASGASDLLSERPYFRPSPRVDLEPIVEQALTAPSRAPESSDLEPQVPRDPLDASYWLPVRAVTTAYCPCSRCCGPYADGLVAWRPGGRPRRTSVHHWGIAADPRVLPYGTRVIVPGYKPSRHFPDHEPWLVDDTGSDMRAAWSRGVLHLDLRYIHHRSAVRYGRKWITVYVDVRGLTPSQIHQLRRFVP